MGCHALLQDIFPTQGSNPCLLWLLHCKWILYWCATREAHYNYSVLRCAVLSHSVMFDFLRPHGRNPPGSSVHGESLGKNIGVGCHSLLQGIFPTQKSNQGLLHRRQILYHNAIFRPCGLQHTRPPCPSPSPRACSNSCPLSW